MGSALPAVSWDPDWENDTQNPILVFAMYIPAY